jgi:hypothetical protein
VKQANRETQIAPPGEPRLSSHLFCLHYSHIAIYKNNDTAQYNNNTAIIIFNIFPCFLNNILNAEPSNAQHIEPVNPTNANKNAKNTSIGSSSKYTNMYEDIAVIPSIIILGLINCSNAPIKKLPPVFLILCALGGTNVLMIKYTMYEAPNIFIGSCIFGTNEYKTVENIKHKIITTKNPASIPKLKTIPFLKPTFFALFIAIILFGPGV